MSTLDSVSLCCHDLSNRMNSGEHIFQDQDLTCNKNITIDLFIKINFLPLSLAAIIGRVRSLVFDFIITRCGNPREWENI